MKSKESKKSKKSKLEQLTALFVFAHWGTIRQAATCNWPLALDCIGFVGTPRSSEEQSKLGNGAVMLRRDHRLG